MTDLERLAAMFRAAGYQEVPPEDWDRWYTDERSFSIHRPAAAGHPGPQSLELGHGEHGYRGFVCSFLFDEEGRFIGHGVWE